MITSNVYADKLKELEKLNYTDRPIIPANEPVFNVFLNTRRIVVSYQSWVQTSPPL